MTPGAALETGAAPGTGARDRDAVAVRRVTVDGVGLRVLEAGAGWPLVLLHGIAGSADEWLEVMPALAERFHVIAPDAPGHGFSDKPAGFVYDVKSYARITLGLMDAVGFRRAPVVALSGGGAVALHLALEHPDRVSRLVLVDAAGLGREVAWSYRLVALPLMEHFFSRGLTRQAIEGFGRALLYNRDRLPPDWIERRQRIWATEGATAAFFATARTGLRLTGQRVEFSRRLRRVRQPALILWGRQDPIIPVRHGERAARLMPNARLHVFERCGHMPVWEYPDELARLVTDFLAE